MSKTIKRLLAVMLVGLTSQVSALELLPNAPQEYVVVPGDTLWDISERFTNDPWKWPEIWHQNTQIENPHLIFPGDRIGLINVNGETRVGVLERGDSSRTVKLTPGGDKNRLQPTARVEPIESAIPAIPAESIRGYLKDHRVVREEELTNAPRIIAGEDNHVVLGAGSNAYARGNFNQQNVEAFSIYRRGQVYRDPESGEVLGLEALGIGLARQIAVQGDIATVELDRTSEQVRIGDVLLPTEDRTLVTRFFPKAPERDVNGQILAVSGGVTQVGQYNVVVLNRGERDGLAVGDVLLVKKAGAVVVDRVQGDKVRLPEERAGSMMVFRTFDKMSYALIMKATRPLRVGDTFSSPD